MSNDAASLKRELRTRALDARRGLSASARKQAAQAVALRIEEWVGAGHLALSADRIVVMAYAAHGSELDCAPSLSAIRAALRARGDHRTLVVAYPRVDDSPSGDADAAVAETMGGAPSLLRLHVGEPRELTAGFRGILEPPCDAPAVEPTDVDLVLVPGVAFGEDGYRLGYGRGFYDLLLHAAPQALAVGLSYDETLYATVPHETHDHPLTAVIAPSSTITVTR